MFFVTFRCVARSRLPTVLPQLAIRQIEIKQDVTFAARHDPIVLPRACSEGEELYFRSMVNSSRSCHSGVSAAGSVSRYILPVRRPSLRTNLM